MPVPNDPYTFVDGPGNTASGEQVNERFDPLYGVLDGGLDAANLLDGAVTAAKISDGTVTEAELAAALLGILGVTGGGVTRRGKSIIATEESRSNVAFGLMPTADRVQGVVLPTDGLICVAYRARWKNSVASAGSAAIFLGANQLKESNAGVPTVIESPGPTTANRYQLLTTDIQRGITSSQESSDVLSDVTTGQILATPNVGGPVYIFAAAGTYEVSIQFKATSGSVTATERKLWVWTMGF